MQLKKFLSQNKPSILTYVGLGGMVLFGVLMYKAYPAVTENLNRASDEKFQNEEAEVLTKREKAWVYVRTLWPTLAIGGASAICIICGNREHNKRNAALAAAYYISESTLKTYQEKVIEEVGEKQERTIREKAAIQRQRDNPPTEEIPVSPIGGYSYDKVYYDLFLDKYFRINTEKFKRALAEFNLMIVKDPSNTCSMKDLYDRLEIPINYDSDAWEWTMDSGNWELDIREFPTVGEIRGVTQEYTVFEYNHIPVNKYSKNYYRH